MTKNYAAENEVLLSKIEGGDTEARNELILKNMGLVHSVVKRFLGRGFEADDLFQIGCIGLIRAAKRFDTSFNVQFSTYAIPMIMGEIKRFIRDDGIIKVSRSLKELAAKAAALREQLTKATGQEPTLNTLAHELGVPASELATALDSRLPPESLYATSDDGSGESKPLIERIESRENHAEETLRRILIGELMCGLSERERTIIHMRYFRLKTQAQIAEKLGISQVQVSRLEKKILLALREKIADA